VDKELTKAKLKAEWQCCKFKLGGVAWSPVLSQAIQAIQYLKGWVKCQAGSTISNNVLQKRARQAKIKHMAARTGTGSGNNTTAIKVHIYYLQAFETPSQPMGYMVGGGHCCTGRSNRPQTRSNLETGTSNGKNQEHSQDVKRMLGPIKERRGLTQVMEPSSGPMAGVLHITKATVEKACLEEDRC